MIERKVKMQKPEQEKEYDLGVIVGRFQTPYLHESHKALFDYVCSKHEKVVCYLGLSPILGTMRNPMDFHQRMVMIQEVYPNVQCFYVKDCPSNEVWVKRLDSMIADIKLPMQAPLLYGSRDSFIKTYEENGGSFDTEELESTSFISATQVRKETSRSIIANQNVRIGMVLASQMRFPTAFTTIDVAILDKDRTKIWLGRKADETKFRFIGGFSDPSTATLEEDVRRETLEETHLTIDDPTYICSMLISDWRYRSEVDKIKTTFWVADRVGGDPMADDDIAELGCFDIADFVYEEGYAPLDTPYKLEGIVNGHRALMTKLLQYLGY
jgi:bifunctional NMN adenylyltransferase/nudix hydrolase